MDQFKPVYISTYVAAVFITSFSVLYQFVTTTVNLAWVGAAIVMWPVALMFVRFATLNVVRTSKNMNSLIGLLVFGTVLSLFGARLDVTAEGNWVPITYAMAGMLGFLVYVYWYSRFDRGVNRSLEIGQSLPPFVLFDVDGAQLSERDFTGKPTLFMFYRGNWCPFCVAQIKELVAQYKDIIALGVDVVLVSPQSQKNTQVMAKKFDVPFKFLVDEDNKVAESLEILNENGTPLGLGLLGYESDTVLPTVFITDQQGKLVYVDLTDNYRVRPEPEAFLKVLKELVKAA